MLSSLYNEAINDAKALKEAAEERAKQQLLESMSPKLKKIVETTINKEMGLYESDIEEDDQKECGTYEADLNNEEHIDEADFDEVDLGEDNCDESDHVNESRQVLQKILGNKNVVRRNLVQSVNSFDNNVRKLSRTFALAESNRVTPRLIQNIDNQIKDLVAESKNIASNDIIKNEQEIKTQFKNSLQELNQMTKRRNSILAENYSSLSRSRHLFEEDEDELDMEEPMDMDDEDDKDMGDIGMEDMDIGDDLSGDDADALEDIARKIRNLGGSPEEDMEEPESEDMEAEADIEEGQMYEIDEMENESWHEADEADETEAAMHHESRRRRFMEARKKKDLEEKAKKKKKELEEKKKEEEKKKKLKEGEVFLEIDENMLRREIARMKRLREGDAQSMASHFGGGKLEDEMFVDMDDSDLNVNANNLGRNLKEGYNGNRQTRLLESTVRQQQQALSGMKKELSEVNLFNAKLLYANKLMQNRDLNSAQQRHIVESLDQAKTLREAKLLFEGLSKSLSRGPSRSGTLTESAARRMTGGSSRSTLSSQSVNTTNKVEMDRWALLAGIKK